MPKFVVKIEVDADSPQQVQQLGNLVQHAITHIPHDDLARLLSKVKENPGIVKTALKFI